MSDPSVGSDAWKDQDKGPTIIGLCWAFTLLSTVFAVARLYVRARIKKRLCADDYYTFIALICGYITAALSTVAVSYGNGKHFSLLTVPQQEGVILWTTAAFCPGLFYFGLPKMAVIALLTRLLNPGTFHKCFLWFIGIWCQLTLIPIVGVLIGRCSPARSLWDFSVPGTCFDKSILIYYSIYAGAYSAFVDLYLAIYPSVVLFKLQMPLRKKLVVCIALGIGNVFRSGAVALYKTTRIPSYASKDFSFDTADLVIWTVIEGSTIVIASSLPVLQPLLEILMGRNPFRGDKNNKQKYPQYSSSGDQSGIEMGSRRRSLRPRDELGMDTINGYERQPGSGAVISSPPVSLTIDGRITRTDIIQVSFDDDPALSTSASQRWRPV